MLQLSRTSSQGATTLACVMQGGDRPALRPLHIVFKHVIRNLPTDGDVEHTVVCGTAKVVERRKPREFWPQC